MSQMFAAPVAITPGVNYVAAYHTDRYGFSRYADGASAPFASQTGKIFTDSLPSAVGCFTYNANEVPGSSAPAFHFNISPIVRYPA